MSCFPWPVSTALCVARYAGFDGVEIFRFRAFWQYTNLKHYRAIASTQDLLINFHETWSFGYTDTTHAILRVPALWGALLPENARLEEQFAGAKENELVVAFPHHLDEIIAAKRPNWAVQTNALWRYDHYDVPFERFIQKVIEHHLPVVFDTQHYLEYENGKVGVENLSLNSERHMSSLKRAFDKLRPQIREIHLNNFMPPKGHDLGRNLPLHEGILNLPEFCQYVKASGWTGTVVPELHPRFFSRYSISKNIDIAKELNDDVRSLFA